MNEEKRQCYHGEIGCANCERRRIRCDRRQPHCAKCDKKRISCPGYDRQLRWVEGVAARGHLRGRTIPTRPSSEDKTAFREDDSKDICSESSMLGKRKEFMTSVAILNTPIAQLSQPCDYPDSLTRVFTDYYRRNLAGLMVWMDSDENHYLVPLATNQPAIGFAIMAFAAQHGAMALPDESVEHARDRCLHLIQTRAQDMTARLIEGDDLGNHGDLADAEWMLASILIMCNYENVRRRLEIADDHRRAARTIVNLFKGQNSINNRDLFAFLRNQLAIDDVLAATTSCDLPLIRNAVTPAPGSDHLLFSRYLTFLHRVTLVSTDAVESHRSISRFNSGLTMTLIRSEFEQARGATLMAAGRLGLAGSSMSRDFICLVEVYHSAGLLYSIRCLDYAIEHASERIVAVASLFDQLAAFENQAAFIQNLAWPTFIAGTECHGDPDRQETIAGLLTAIHEGTRFSYYLDAVNFLKEFWAGENDDWRPLARMREAIGQRVLVV
ncbi:LOW QUALITY PROTEIN: putative Zn(II)2Cys6 transcription factor [Colletotrichum acutatum]|uniref:Zn(II)2Cys6 transcription factor n=1 Tax=Glomerella acutata TaxID=27357 RepID=A0AAD8U5G9_GLOAC|nr:LOW QUALITY PROTEIN: putative Zn(II)2Cys6 transcription factor [Colletotrichum acutatum]KAK1705633.1 LOW QUALITY PROTEIN: putative Zn(II)2Cys6 transcription factor [Colletotrichum acutatum]